MLCNQCKQMDDRDIFCLGNELDSCAIKGCCNIKKNNRAI